MFHIMEVRHDSSISDYKCIYTICLYAYYIIRNYCDHFILFEKARVMLIDICINKSFLI